MLALTGKILFGPPMGFRWPCCAPHFVAVATVLGLGCRSEPTPTPPPSVPESSKPAPAARESPDWKAAFRHEVRVRVEQTAPSVVVDLKVADGFHVYTVGETIGRPLRLEIDDAGDYVASGDVVYPKGTTKDLPIGRSVIVEGEAEVVAPLKAKEGVQQGRARGTFHYQVCNDEACDRPRTAAFEVDVSAGKS